MKKVWNPFNLKPTAYLLLLVRCLALPAYGTVSISWLSGYGIDDPATPGAGYDLPVGSRVQLIWSTNNSIEAVNPDDPTTPQGDDVLLDELFTTSIGAFSSGGTYDAVVDHGWGEDAYLTGYVYLRVFNTANPAGGTWYGESALVGGPLKDQDPPPGPTPDVVDIAPVETFVLNQQLPLNIQPSGIAGALFASNNISFNITNMTAGTTNYIERSFDIMNTNGWVTVFSFPASGAQTNWTEVYSNEWSRAYYRIRTE